MKKISRSDFLKISGLSFGGILMLPHHSCSGIFNKKLTINDTNNYQIVIPANASKIEEEASLQLKKHLLLLSNQAPNVVKENEYNGKNGIFIGQTNNAKKNNVFESLKDQDVFLELVK